MTTLKGDQMSSDVRQAQSPITPQAHTPGPWRVEPDLSNIGKGGVTMSTGNAIGTADDYEWGYLRIEDARLIAAAPELLAALQELVAAGEFAVSSLDDVASMLRLGQATDNAKAAIAKAEGRT